MTSKISLGKLIREDLRHRHWMMALSCLTQFFAGPVGVLLVTNGVRPYNPDMAGARERLANSIYRTLLEYFSSASPILGCLIAGVGALLVGIFGFRHLFSRRMADLYESAPITRKDRFLAGYLSGFFVWAVPAVVSLLLTLILGQTRLLADVPIPGARAALCAATGKALLVSLFTFLTVYHLCILAASISGSVFNSLVNTALIGLDVIILKAMTASCGGIFFRTYIPDSESAVRASAFSPLASPVVMCYYLVRGANEDVPVPVWKEVPFFFFASIAVTALLGAGAFFCYKKRASEEAEGGVANRAVQAVLRTLNAFLAGIFGGLLMNQVVVYHRTVWSVFGIVVGAVLAYAVMDIIHQRRFQAALSHKLPMAVTTLCAVVLFLAYSMDWFGYDAYLPSESNIASAQVYFAQYREPGRRLSFEDGRVEYTYGREEDQWVTMTDPAQIRSILASGTGYAVNARKGRGSENRLLTNVQVRVKRRFGFSYTRSYALNMDCIDAVRSVVETESYRTRNYPSCSGAYPTPDLLDVETTAGGMQEIRDAAWARELTQAYYQDFAEHYCVERLTSSVSVGRLKLEYLDRDPKQPESTIYRTVSLNIGYDYKRTLSLIREYWELLPIDIGDLMRSEPYLDLELSWNADGEYEMSKEMLYSYFGVPGAPALDTYKISDQNPAYSVEIGLGSADPALLYPCLVIGDYNGYYGTYNCDFSGLRPVGTLETRNNYLQVFVKNGTVPKEFVDGLTLETIPYDHEVHYSDEGYYDGVMDTF
ncbi:MAG: hypothetical protein K6E92_09420 [Lachnospiraceae bacterium]|nr:hypothetical protein [Lachnospiraceae bacterium]